MHVVAACATVFPRAAAFIQPCLEHQHIPEVICPVTFPAMCSFQVRRIGLGLKKPSRRIRVLIEKFFCPIAQRAAQP